MTGSLFPQLFFRSNPGAQFRVFIFAGQSNIMTLGSNSIPVELQTPDPAVTIWNIFTQSWQTYVAGTNSFSNDSGAGNVFGPEGEFARQYRITYPTRNVAIIKYGVSATPLFQQASTPNDWNAASVGDYFDITKTEIIAALAAIGGTYSIDGVCWMQGETDAQIDVSWANAYEANLTAFIAAVRAQWTGGNTPFHIGRISDSSLWTFRSTVRAAQLAVSDADPLADIISTDTYPLQGDNAHYTEAGVKSLGADFFSAHSGTYVFPG